MRVTLSVACASVVRVSNGFMNAVSRAAPKSGFLSKMNTNAGTRSGRMADDEYAKPGQMSALTPFEPVGIVNGKRDWGNCADEPRFLYV